ncbi:HU family DNA-binding protein [archaeon]
MNKHDLTLRLAKKLDISQRLANDAIDTMIGEITTAVKKGQRVTLVGFGTFYRAKRAARMGRNPQTGMRMRIPAARVPRFKAGDAFKIAVK